MRFTEWFRKIFLRKKIDSETEEFMEKAEKIKPEKPLDYDNESADLMISNNEPSL